MKKAALLLAAVLLCVLLASCGGASYTFDEENMKLVQLETPADDQPAVKLETSVGDVYVVLYPDEAPVACENFSTLVGKGWYDGTEFFRIEPETACIAGSKTTDGEEATTIYDGEQFENEYTSNMWAFTGAVGTISDTDGMSDSRFFLIANAPVTEEYLSSMQTYGFPQTVIDKFTELGGVPPFTQRYTFFGQVFGGQSVVNSICATPVDGEQYPTNGAIVIEHATLITYKDIPQG